jgi:hypothetical protein
VRLPTKREIRQNRSIEKRDLKQREYEERVEARRLLFGKAKGKHKNLTSKELKFVIYVKKKGYAYYLEALSTGLNRWNRGPKWRKVLRRTARDPLPYRHWCWRWWASNLQAFRAKDIPREARMKWEVMQGETRNSRMSEQQRRGLLEVGCETSEREQRGLDIPLRDVQADPSGEQGRDT